MMVMRYTKCVTIDLCFLFEGQASDELPERLLGGLRFHNLDPELCSKLTPIPAAAAPASGGSLPSSPVQLSRAASAPSSQPLPSLSTAATPGGIERTTSLK
jgi:hypothetical protein